MQGRHDKQSSFSTCSTSTPTSRRAISSSSTRATARSRSTKAEATSLRPPTALQDDKVATSKPTSPSVPSGTLVAQFPVTTGSSHDPLPLGTWKVRTFSFLPPFNYQPDLFWDVADDKAEQKLPPGPNGPVGVAWLDLSKEHYGIHGTDEPSTIQHTESHGCLRLTNWDVMRLSRMMKPGFTAYFVA